MTTVKRGHAAIASSLRPEEVVVVDEFVGTLNDRARLGAAIGEQYQPARWTRAELIRAAVRYVLEHRNEFVKWLAESRA